VIYSSPEQNEEIPLVEKIRRAEENALGSISDGWIRMV